MRLPVFLCLWSAVGCAPYTAVQIDLVEQARKGVANAADHQKLQRADVEALRELRRKRLDEAFDADVVANGALSSDWVIEHRRAYAAGIDLLHQKHAAALMRVDKSDENLAAVDAALRQLHALQSIQIKWSILRRERANAFDLIER